MSIGFPCTQQQANVILNLSLQPLLSDSAHQPISCTSLVRPSWHRLSPFAYASPERPPRSCHGPRGSPARNCWGPPATEPQITKTIRRKKGKQTGLLSSKSPISEAFPRVFALVPPLKGHRQCPVPGPGPQFPAFSTRELPRRILAKGAVRRDVTELQLEVGDRDGESLGDDAWKPKDGGLAVGTTVG